jgi:hypothetical protein
MYELCAALGSRNWLKQHPWNRTAMQRRLLLSLGYHPNEPNGDALPLLADIVNEPAPLFA